MPRKAQGSTYTSDGAIFARVVVAPKKYVARSLAGIVAVGDEAGARAWASTLQELVDALRELGRTGDVTSAIETAVRVGREDPANGLDRVRRSLAKRQRELDEIRLSAMPARRAKPGATTFRKFGERWTSGELHREYPDHVREKKSSVDDISRLEAHIYPVIGHLPLGEITLKHAHEVMRRIPAGRSSATRRQIAQVMSRVLNMAVYPAEEIKASPLPKGFLPKVRTRVGRYLLPAEDAALLACTKPEVPLLYRVLWGFLAREGMRKDEALRLTWGDLDLEHGKVALDENKTDDPRAWALDPSVVAALKRWREIQKEPPSTAKVFTVVDHTHLPEDLRAHLKAAGVTRADLFATTATHRQINVHGLRATFVTTSLANGKTETWVMDRTGHESSQMVNRYRRQARTWAELDLGPLTPLDQAIPELAADRRCGEGAGRPSKPRPRTTKKTRPIKVVGRAGHDPATYGLKERARCSEGNRDPGFCRRIEGSMDAGCNRSDASLRLPADVGAGAEQGDRNLEQALATAAADRQWDVVRVLAEELRGRRLAREGVEDLERQRR
jgi:integrase